MKRAILYFVFAFNLFIVSLAFSVAGHWERCDLLELGVLVLLVVWFVCDLVRIEDRYPAKIPRSKFIGLPLKTKIELLQQGVQIIDG